MLNFAEQTGSGAVIVVWSFLIRGRPRQYKKYSMKERRITYYYYSTYAELQLNNKEVLQSNE
jgi:hypothetical protein